MTNHQQPQTLVVSAVELPTLLAAAYRTGRRVSLECVSRCPQKWRVTYAPCRKERKESFIATRRGIGLRH